ncbi:uncharacterized protein LOC124653656 [Lolium rigidum]|jgi:uncharacterized protein (UPF0335 family)|uniref:uncharacterized protein LOC124653656 n=1 Tax=Lolium rigidum TaxID=89674 RepID=UPI001F5C2DA4|nr:uncharacterized protein LOC124653656 [Lolium rigidum]
MAMATHTGVAASKVLILVGAGLTGSIVLRNGRLSDVLAELQELMKGVNQGEGPGALDMALIQAQIRNLAQEVRDLTLSKPITILSGKSDSGGSLSSYILPAAAVGALGYCYMWCKGWSLSDVMFVTKRNMASAVDSMSKQLEQVSSALAATKRHLTKRLENLDGKMDEQVEMSKHIRTEVIDVKTDLSQIGFDVEAIQQMVAGLEEKIELLDNKQDAANAGIWYLCRMAGGIKEGLNTKFFQEADEKLKLLDVAQTEKKSVKGLELFLESSTKEVKAIDSKPNTIAQNDAKKPMKTFDVPLKSAAVHRSNRVLFRKEGLAL